MDGFLKKTVWVEHIITQLMVFQLGKILMNYLVDGFLQKTIRVEHIITQLMVFQLGIDLLNHLEDKEGE